MLFTGWIIIPDYIFCASMRSPELEFYESEFYKKYNSYKNALHEYQHDQQAKKEAFWRKQTGHEFEREVARLYQKMGYSAVVSRSGGDGGIDIILSTKTERIAVQCKHHKKPVSPAIIRDLYGTMLANNYAKGVLVSLNGFTSGTRSFARGKPIKLVDIHDLIRMSEEIEKTQ